MPDSKGPDLSPKATIERLGVWLERNYGPKKPELDRRHGPYLPGDVVTANQGWLVTKNPCSCTCPPYDGNNLYPRGQQHLHWFHIRGLHARLYRGPLKFWEELKKMEVINAQIEAAEAEAPFTPTNRITPFGAD